MSARAKDVTFSGEWLLKALVCDICGNAAVLLLVCRYSNTASCDGALPVLIFMRLCVG